MVSYKIYAEEITQGVKRFRRAYATWQFCPRGFEGTMEIFRSIQSVDAACSPDAPQVERGVVCNVAKASCPFLKITPHGVEARCVVSVGLCEAVHFCATSEIIFRFGFYEAVERICNTSVYYFYCAYGAYA
mgnify:CR=1 FL=1